MHNDKQSRALENASCMVEIAGGIKNIVVQKPRMVLVGELKQ